MNFLKTNIAGFDEFLQGGLPPRVLLLMGAPGSGSEVFARQIAFARAKQCKVTYFIVNSTPEAVRLDLETYGWNITPLEESDNWKFKTIPKAGPFIQDVTAEIKKKRFVIIDSLSEILLTREVEEAVELLTAMAHQNGCECQEFNMVLLTEGMQSPQAEIAMQHFAEGVISFSTTWSADNMNRHVIIKKMKGTLAPARRLPYTIGKRGFVIETAIRIT
jgi:KaiC/GvpD/RAD55 family RecA-like ATPase